MSGPETQGSPVVRFFGAVWGKKRISEALMVPTGKTVTLCSAMLGYAQPTRPLTQRRISALP